MRHVRPSALRIRLVLPLLALAALGATWAPAAQADGDAYPGAYAGWFRSYGVPSIYRGGGCDCGPRPLAVDRGCAPRWDACRGAYGSHGTPWSVMRRYLSTEPYRATWHRHPRYWWLKRWPCRYATAPGYGAHACPGTEVGPHDCPFAVAALADGTETLGTEERLVRGLERFHAGAFDRAAEDFRAVADADPADARAAYGRLMCSYVAKDWTASAEALRRLVALDALDARDRVEAEGGFDERKRFTNLADALVTHTAALRRVELAAPRSPVGRSTVEAIQSGLIYGYAGLVDGLVGRIMSTLDAGCPVVATGGLAAVMIDFTTAVTALEPDLTLIGLAEVYARNE